MKLNNFKRALLIIVILLLAGLIVWGQKALRTKEAMSIQKSLEIDDLESDIKLESQKAEEINKGKEDDATDEDYEALARKELGLIKKDEIVIKPR